MQSNQNGRASPLSTAAARCVDQDNVGLPSDNNQPVIATLNENDVLLGRGKETINYIGNIKFRAIIEAHKVQYISNRSKEGKDLIARQVCAEVEKRGGRFLKKVINGGDETGVWVVWVAQSAAVALLKIKQAFQYQLYQKEQLVDSRKTAAEATSAQSGADGGRLNASLKSLREDLPVTNRTNSPPRRHPPMKSGTASGQFTYPVPPGSPPSHVQSPASNHLPATSTTKSTAKTLSAFARPKQTEDKERIREGIPRSAAPVSAKPSSTANTAAEKTGIESGSDSSMTQSVHSADETDYESATRAGPEDVLLGRGDDVSTHAGTILFQKLVMDRKREYLSAAPSDRERLAREIKDDVAARRGRFLKRVEELEDLWVRISSKAAMKKIKQSFLYTYNTDTAPKDTAYYQSIAVRGFTKNDVLLGRGRRTINNEGNIRFRLLISARKPEYAATSVHSDKDRIARDVKKAVEARNGRFLEKLEGTEDAWVPADEAVILKKIKLCFRYHHAETLGEQGSVACPSLGRGASNASLFEAAKNLAGIHLLPDHCSEVPVPAKFRNAFSSKEHDCQEHDSEALEASLPPVLASPFVVSVMQPIHTADLRPDDVLLGQGKETFQYIGNIRFRQLVEQKKGLYLAKPSCKEKDHVARSVKAIIESRNGRFLKRVENSELTWLPIDDSVAMLEIKAAFQYALYQKESRDGGDSNDQNKELSEASSQYAELDVHLGRNAVPNGSSATSFGDEKRIQDLMATMKQQLVPCQSQLGGANKIQALVERSIRNLQVAVSQNFSGDSGIAKSRASAASAADIDQSWPGVSADRKPSPPESDCKASISKSEAETDADWSDAQTLPAAEDRPISSLRASNQLPAATTNPTGEEELRQQLIFQVSSMSTDELLNLATLVRAGTIDPPRLAGNRNRDHRTMTTSPRLQDSGTLIAQSSRASRNDADGALASLLEFRASVELREHKRNFDDLTDGSLSFADNNNNGAKKRKSHA